MYQLQKTPMRALLFVVAVLLVVLAVIDRPTIPTWEAICYAVYIGIAAYFAFAQDKGGEE